MTRAKVLRFGEDLVVVRLPPGFHLAGGEVEIFRRGDEIVLRELPNSVARAFHLLASLPDDAFPEPRRDEPPQDRADWTAPPT
jgi:antitoxin VapB